MGILQALASVVQVTILAQGGHHAPIPPVGALGIAAALVCSLLLVAGLHRRRYELTQQVRRSLRFVWRSSEGRLYREQKRLVDLGWATVENEPAGQRTRNRYTITDAGRAAFEDWLAAEPEEPHFQIEGVLRTFFGDQGNPQQLASAMQATAQMARSMLGEMLGSVDEYLEEGGPLWMLEQGIGASDDDRIEFHGRPMYPERLHVVALAIDITTQLLETIDNFVTHAANEVAIWSSTSDATITPNTRDRLQRIHARSHEALSEQLGRPRSADQGR